MHHEKPANQRAQNSGQSEHRTKRALIAAALGGRDQIAHDGHGRNHQAAAAKALQEAEGD